MTERHHHTIEKDGVRRTWFVERLWVLAAELEVVTVPIESIAGIDENVWFWDGHHPTIRNVADRVRRVGEADLTYPIILSADGAIMDGAHRLALALVEGRQQVRVVRFEKTPPPDVEDRLTSKTA